MATNPEPSIEIKNLGKSEKEINEEYMKNSEEFFEGLQKSKREKQEKLEKITEEKLKEQQNAEKEEEDIREEIETMLDEDEDEQVIFEKRRDLYKAKKESEIKLEEYLFAAVESNPELAKEYGITYEDRYTKNPGELLDKAVKGRKKLFGEKE